MPPDPQAARLLALIPPYAADIARNLEVLAAEDVLEAERKWGTFLACAHATGTPEVVRAIEAVASAHLSAEAADAARAAAAIMGMNNIYYRALHIMRSPEYQTLPARLRMTVIANPGVEKAHFELWSFAVSAINGCGVCLDAHEGELKKHAVPAVEIQCALRIAAVVHAAGRVLAAEAARSASSPR